MPGRWWIAAAAATAWVASMADPAPAAEPLPLTVGTNVFVGYEPLYLARSLGSYDGTGIRLIEYSSATRVVQAVRSRTIDAAALTLDEVLLAREYGVPLRIVLVTDSSAGTDAIVVQPGIEDVAALRGRRIGAEQSATGAIVLGRALELAGLTPDDVTIVRMEIGEQEDAFRARRVDAVVTFDPVRRRLLDSGARQVFDTTRIPGEIVDVVAVDQQALRHRSNDVGALLRGWFRAVAYLRGDPETAAARLAPRLRIGPVAVLETLKGLALGDAALNRRLLTGTAPSLVESARRIATWMQSHKLLEREASVDDLIDAGVLQQVLLDQPTP